MPQKDLFHPKLGSDTSKKEKISRLHSFTKLEPQACKFLLETHLWDLRLALLCYGREWHELMTTVFLSLSLSLFPFHSISDFFLLQLSQEYRDHSNPPFESIHGKDTSNFDLFPGILSSQFVPGRHFHQLPPQAVLEAFQKHGDLDDVVEEMLEKVMREDWREEEEKKSEMQEVLVEAQKVWSYKRSEMEDFPHLGGSFWERFFFFFWKFFCFRLTYILFQCYFSSPNLLPTFFVPALQKIFPIRRNKVITRRFEKRPGLPFHPKKFLSLFTHTFLPGCSFEIIFTRGSSKTIQSYVERK